MTEKILTLALGGNIGEREQYIEKAIQSLDTELNTPFLRRTGIAYTKALGFDGPEFANLIVQYKCSLEPEQVLEICKSIERRLGRSDVPEFSDEGTRIYHDRTIDIDILTYGDVRMNTPLLTIPHPQIETRPYVKMLLSELCNS